MNSKLLINLLLSLTGFVLIVAWLTQVVQQYRKADKNTSFFTFKRFRYPLLVGLIAGVPILLLNLFSVGDAPIIAPDVISSSQNFIFCVVVALLISLVWIRYVWLLDIYDREKWTHVAAIFLLSAALSFLCWPLYNLFESLGFSHSTAPLPDFIFCVFGIGLIEETVKFIPFLILLRFTKAINEPFDYLLYASVSALGFAFAENSLYLNSYGLNIIAARAFYASVAHMTFCSTVTYGLLLKKFRFTKYPTWAVFLFFFGIAIFSHGFYDFWLINESVASLQGLTTVFFLLTIHIWFTMKNNAINVSNFFDERVVLDNNHLMQHLVVGLLSLFMFSYIWVAFFYGTFEANQFLAGNAIVYGYIIFYLIASFGRFHIVRGYLAPFQVPFNFFIPTLRKKSS